MARSGSTEMEIATLGGHGDGIAETPVGRVYVPFTVPGDVVEARLGARVGEGRAASLLALIRPGPERTEPSCPHFHACGGCALQHVSETFYGEWKRRQVMSALQRRGLDGEVVAPLVATPPAERRRADWIARRLAAGILLGFHERGSRRIADVGHCAVLAPALVGLLAPLRSLLKPVLPVGAVADAQANLTETGVDLVLRLPAPPDLAQRQRLTAFADEQDLARLAVACGADMAEIVVERRAPVVRFGGVAVTPPPGGFLQASPTAERAMIAEVTAAAAGAGRVADLHAGCGTFSLPLSAAAEVQAVEADAAALAALQSAANRVGRRVACERRDLDRRPLEGRELERFGAVVMDPPRAGAREQAAALAASRVPVVIAVSCAPGTFARDARLLVDGGYRLERVVPIDQFLWSTQVELVGVFRR